MWSVCSRSISTCLATVGVAFFGAAASVVALFIFSKEGLVMKKAISLILALALCLSLCSCGKSKAAKNVEALIDAIGDVTADSEAAVVAAEQAYDGLSAEEKENIENYAALTSARTALDAALLEKHLEELYAAVVGEWVNVYDMDRYVFNADGSGTHEGKSIEFTIDPEDQMLSVIEGVSNLTPQKFSINLEQNTPRLIPEPPTTYYVDADHYDAIAQELREEYTAILVGYEYWSNTQGLNYIMFGESGGGFFLLSGTTLDMSWEWLDNNTIKASFEYSGTRYSNVLTIINTTEGPRLVNDQNVVQFVPKNKLH